MKLYRFFLNLFFSPIKNPLLLSDSKLIFICLLFSITPIVFIIYIYKGFFNHDSLDVLINYKYNFDTLNTYNFLPLWNPYLAYGITTSLSNFILSGSQYLTLFIGYIVHSNSFLYLFYGSIALDTFLYLAGIVLVLKHLKIPNYINFYATSIAALTLNPIASFGFDYYFFIKLPLLLYFIIWVSEKFSRRLIFFILFYLSYIFAGMPIYFSILYLYITVLIFSLNFFANTNFYIKNSDSNNNTVNLKALASISCIIILAYCYSLNLLDILRNYQLLAPGRLADGSSSYTNFISYGGFTGPGKLLGFVGGAPLTQDFDLFLGIIPSALSLYSIFLFKENYKSRKILIQLWCLIFLILIFTHPFHQSYFHKFIYYLPLVNKIRHLAYFITLIKPILIILSAISINNLIHKKKFFYFNNFIYLISLILVIFLYFKLYFEFFLIILMFLILLLYKNSRIFSYYIIFIFSLIDIFHHRLIDFPYEKYKYNQEKFHSIANDKFPFLLRTDPKQSINLRLFDESIRAAEFARYSSEVTYIREDFCYQTYRQDYLLKNLYKEFQKNKLNFNTFFQEFSEVEIDKLKNREKFGCNRPKIEAYQQQFTNTPSTVEGAKNRIKNSDLQIQVTDFSPNWLDFKINNMYSSTKPIIYYDAFHPYWEVYIDKKKEAIFKINGAFKGILIKNGEHDVRFKIKIQHQILELIKAFILSGALVLLLIFCTKRIKNCRYL